jgi:hypothetical protein
MEEIPMKPANLLAAALVMLASLPLMAKQVMAQQAGAAAEQAANVNAAGSRANQAVTEDAKVDPIPGGVPSVKGAANASFSAPLRLRLLNVELVGKLDAKSAKVGEPVVLKTQEPTSIGNGTVIPKGTRLVGHVIAVQAHGKGVEDSEVAVQFDRAELKSGQGFAIHSVIRSVMPPATAGVIDSMHSGDNLGGGVMGGGMRTVSGSGALRTGDGAAGASGGGTITSGGLIVGDGRGAVRGGTELDNTVATAPNGAGRGTVGNDPAMSGMAAARPHATGVRGVMLASDASGKISGTFSAVKQNVHLDGGTQMVLGVAVVQ